MYRLHFDYGAIVDTQPNRKVWPQEGRKIALIDGDMLPYIVGYTTSDKDVMRAKFRIDIGECKTIQETPEFWNAKDHCNWVLNKWVRMAGCDAAKVYLTDSANNFRLKIAFRAVYKGQRPPEKPPFFYELREYLNEVHSAILSNGNEADDLMSIELMRAHHELCDDSGIEIGSEEHKAFSNVVVVSRDKDTPITIGYHCNPDTEKTEWTTPLGTLTAKYKMSSKPTADYVYDIVGVYTKGAKAGEPKRKRWKVGESCKPKLDKVKGTGLKFFYAQLVMGDGADNYKGIEGRGQKFAYELLKDAETEREMFELVLGAYKDAYAGGKNIRVPVTDYNGRTAMLTPYQLMLETGRLAWMQTYDGELWRAKDYCPTIDDEVWK